MSENTKFLLLFGSQTGQAEAIAQEVFDNADVDGLIADVHALSSVDKEFSLDKISLAVFITSTTGDGDPPDNAVKFYGRIKKKTLPKNHLKHLRFTLLGLGDSNYNNFCNFGKTLNSRLLDLGATHFYPPAWADDAVGLEIAVEPWIDKLNEAIKKEIKAQKMDSASDAVIDSTCDNNIDQNKSIDKTTDNNFELNKVELSLNNIKFFKENSLINSLPPLCDEELIVPPLPPRFIESKITEDEFIPNILHPQNNHDYPFCQSSISLAKIKDFRLLNKKLCERTAMLINLDISSCGWHGYNVGDSMSIICPNNSEEVNQLLKRLDILAVSERTHHFTIINNTTKRKPVIPLYIPPKSTPRHILTWCLDIRACPKKAFLYALSECTKDEREKRRIQELCSRNGGTHYQSFIRECQISILDLLLTFPSCQPTIDLLLEHLPRLQPRPYSIASSSLVDSSLASVAFNVVNFDLSDGRKYSRKGVCTGWLEKMASDKSQGSKVGVFLRSNQNFHLPSDLSTPIIMIGPGTGVTPFIGFLQERRHLKRENPKILLGESWLFFGCRHKEQDYIFEEELSEFVLDGTLTELLVCFSRDLKNTVEAHYVQDNIRRRGEDITDLIMNRGSKVYVCGDAKRMSKDVQSAIEDCLLLHSDMTEDGVKDYIKEMRKNHFYLEDVWA